MSPTPYEFLLIYPVDGQFPLDPLHFEDVAHRWVDWFATNLG